MNKPVDRLSLMFAPPRLFQEIDDLSLPSHKKTYIIVFRQLALLRVIFPMVFELYLTYDLTHLAQVDLPEVWTQSQKHTYRIFMHYTDLRLQVRLCKVLSESNCSARPMPKGLLTFYLTYLLTSYPILPSDVFSGIPSDVL